MKEPIRHIISFGYTKFYCLSDCYNILKLLHRPNVPKTKPFRIQENVKWKFFRENLILIIGIAKSLLQLQFSLTLFMSRMIKIIAQKKRFADKA